MVLLEAMTTTTNKLGRMHFAEANDQSGIWVAIVAAIGVIGAAVAPAWMKSRQERQDKKAADEALDIATARLKRYRAGFVDQLACYELFNLMLREGAHRVVLWEGKDSGGWPSVGKPYTVSPVQALTRHDVDNVILGYRNLQVDLAYTNMLLKSLEKPLSVIVNDPATMEAGMLRDFYVAEEITHAVLIGLDLDIEANTYNYMSIATHEGHFTPEQITKFRVACNEIRNLITAGRERRL